MGDFQTTTKPKSLKHRNCPECRAAIQPGSRYVRVAGAYEGDFFSAIQCEPCHAFGERFMTSLSLASWLNQDEATFPFGDMLHQAAEHLEFKWEGPSGSGQWPAKRDAMMALFDAFDERERAEQKKDREQAQAARERASRMPPRPQRYLATSGGDPSTPSPSFAREGI